MAINRDLRIRMGPTKVEIGTAQQLRRLSATQTRDRREKI
jgi:hypothetical protein